MSHKTERLLYAVLSTAISKAPPTKKRSNVVAQIVEARAFKFEASRFTERALGVDGGMHIAAPHLVIQLLQ